MSSSTNLATTSSIPSVHCPECPSHPPLFLEETYLVCHVCGYIDSHSSYALSHVREREYGSSSTSASNSLLGNAENVLLLDKTQKALKVAGQTLKNQHGSDEYGKRAVYRQKAINSVILLINGLSSLGGLANEPSIPTRAFWLFNEFRKDVKHIGDRAKIAAAGCVLIAGREKGLSLRKEELEPFLFSQIELHSQGSDGIAHVDLDKVQRKIISKLRLVIMPREKGIERDEGDIDRLMDHLRVISKSEDWNPIERDFLGFFAESSLSATSSPAAATSTAAATATAITANAIRELTHHLLDLHDLVNPSDARSRSVLLVACFFASLESTRGAYLRTHGRVVASLSTVLGVAMYTVKERYTEIIKIVEDWMEYLPMIGKERPIHEMMRIQHGKRTRVIPKRALAVLLLGDVVKWRHELMARIEEESKMRGVGREREQVATKKDPLLAFLPPGAVVKRKDDEEDERRKGIGFDSEEENTVQPGNDMLENTAAVAKIISEPTSDLSATLPVWPEPGSVPPGEGWTSTTTWLDPRLPQLDPLLLGQHLQTHARIKTIRKRKRGEEASAVYGGKKAVYANYRPSLSRWMEVKKRSGVVSQFLKEWQQDHVNTVDCVRQGQGQGQGQTANVQEPGNIHPLKKMLLDGIPPASLPIFLFPSSILHASAILRSVDPADIPDEDLFTLGEMESYLATREEQEIALKMWVRGGMDEAIKTREKMKKAKGKKNKQEEEEVQGMGRGRGKVKIRSTKVNYERMIDIEKWDEDGGDDDDDDDGEDDDKMSVSFDCAILPPKSSSEQTVADPLIISLTCQPHSQFLVADEHSTLQDYATLADMVIVDEDQDLEENPDPDHATEI